MIRRGITVSLLAATMLVGTQSAVLADELSDSLDRHATSVYSGEQTVVCDTPDGNTSEVFEIGQSEGVAVSRDASGETRIARVAVGAEDLDGHYAILVGDPRTYAGRAVDQIDVVNADVLRLRFLFDSETGAMLASDVFNADGTIYCRTRLADFSPGQAGISEGVTYSEPEDLVLIEDVAESAFPSNVGAFERTTVTEGPLESISSAYYEDGAFGFTLLYSRSAIAVPELEDAPSVDLAQGKYHRKYDVGTAVYSWESNLGGYVLAGDLPIDMQLNILEGLPAPESVSVFKRIWRNLFN